jgi:glycosyltransferase involved in cell wall biosynthesis
MKMCLIGKYPPIEGGVSASTYWLARGLAERGHQIHIVTNASEVEKPYRMYLSKNDEAWYEPAFSSGGFVRVSNPEGFSRSRMGHIPVANPFVSKLAGLATQTIRQYKCDFIFCYYYEPYALAGYLASIWTGAPLLVKHAGSDLERLMAVPDLAVAYKEMLRRADGVITTGRDLTRRFRGMGIREERIIRDVPFFLPTHVFSPDASPLSVYDLVKEVADCGFRESTYVFDHTRPTIGMYGKVGTVKGSFDLVCALAMLKKEGLQFNFLTMAQGNQAGWFQQAVHDYGLED